MHREQRYGTEKISVGPYQLCRMIVERLRQFSRMRGLSEEQVIEEALERYLEQEALEEGQ